MHPHAQKMLLWLPLLANLNYGRVQGRRSELGSDCLTYSREPPHVSEEHRELLPRADPCWGHGYHTLFEARHVVFHESQRSATAVCQLGQYYPNYKKTPNP